MEKSLVSIIVPIYNVEMYLSKCIESILDQSYSFFELILVNDGSSDNCGEICEEFSKIDTRIKVIHKSNEGVSCARNIGIIESKGKYIMFADSDDYVEPTWCEQLVKSIEENVQSLVVSTYYVHNIRKGNNKKIMMKGIGNNKNTLIEKKEFFILYEKSLLNSPFNKIYDSRIIKENNIHFKHNISLGEDLLFNLEYLKYIKGDIIIVNESLYNYILRDRESLDNKYTENLFDIYKLLYSELENCFTLFGTDTLKIRESFSNSYLMMLHAALDNTFHKKSDLSFVQKIKYNNLIIKSSEFKTAYKHANLNEYDHKYLKILQLENYFWIYLLKNLSDFKRKFFK